MDAALSRLDQFLRQQARIAEMRYFGGLVVGGFTGVNHRNHGFVRTDAGVLTQIDAAAQASTFVTGISPGHVTTGFYFLSSEGPHG